MGKKYHHRVWFWKPRTGVVYRPKHKFRSQIHRGKIRRDLDGDCEWDTNISIKENDNLWYEGSFQVQNNGKCKIITNTIYEKDYGGQPYKELIIIPKKRVKFKKYYYNQKNAFSIGGFWKVWNYELKLNRQDIVFRKMLYKNKVPYVS